LTAAVALRECGENRKALKELDLAAKAGADPSKILLEKGRNCAAVKEYWRAVTFLGEGIDSASPDKEFHRELSDVFDQIKKSNTAASDGLSAPGAGRKKRNDYRRIVKILAKLQAGFPEEKDWIFQAAAAIFRETRGRHDAGGIEKELKGLLAELDQRHDINCLVNETETLNQTRCSSGPVSLLIVVTNDCNLRCAMCPRVKEASQTLPYEAFKNIEPFFPGVSSIGWQGGEVFMAPYFMDLLRTLQENHPHISHHITTNGLLIDRQIAGILSRGRVVLQFSVDSVKKKTYEAIRIGGDFDTLLRNLDTLCAAYPPVIEQPFSVNAVVMKQNIYDLPLFPDFCKKYRVGQIKFSYIDGVANENLFSTGNAPMVKDLAKIMGDVETRCRV
jgi:sulfatase maturation enzyme AslB (radical SAM superfamily)